MLKARLSFATILILHLTMSLPTPAYAQTVEWTEANGCIDQGVATVQGLECLIQNILIVGLRLIGIAILFMIVYGGFKYLISRGDPKAAESAKSTLTYAIMGLILAVCAWMILVAIAEFTGSDTILDFQIIKF